VCRNQEKGVEYPALKEAEHGMSFVGEFKCRAGSVKADRSRNVRFTEYVCNG